uniref:Cell division cycle protein 16 homolog (inferred by orthology to a human protein) n=1 Tax=Anisakis simplex TaxID=6269 RepID=A0A0M3JBK8_ANISI
LVHLRKSDELFMLSHKLVDNQPDHEFTWYAVGCYYYVIGQFGAAKNFLNKCITMNSSFGEGWLAFGHVLSAESEHEQAMNCYLRVCSFLRFVFTLIFRCEFFSGVCSFLSR